jgi:uncharacterized membrane protein
MMKEKIKNPLLISITGNSLMVIARIAYAGNLYYGFLLWNLLLAGIPLLISNSLYKSLEIKRSVLYSALALWLLFLPNAPYIITDLVHLCHRPPVPFWYDMLLVILSASNGLALGFISMYQVERIIFRRRAEKFLLPFRVLVMLAMGYGVYMGRYLRFNSWDAIFNPIEVFRGAMSSFHLNTAGFVLTFGFVTFILYSFFTAIVLRRSQEVF